LLIPQFWIVNFSTVAGKDNVCNEGKSFNSNSVIEVPYNNKVLRPDYPLIVVGKTLILAASVILISSTLPLFDSDKEAISELEISIFLTDKLLDKSKDTVSLSLTPEKFTLNKLGQSFKLLFPDKPSIVKF